MESPVIFSNRKGENLFGMVFRPESDDRKHAPGIIICVSSILYRIGPYRLHTTISRHLSSHGYWVLQFDPAGIGDSEGAFEEKPLLEHHVDIQKGKFCEDIEDAVDFFLKEYHLGTIILAGLCGGAVSAIIAAAKHNRVNGSILLAMPILFDNLENKNQFSEVSVISSGVQSAHILSGMILRLTMLQTWKKIFTLKIAWKNELAIVLKASSVLFSRLFDKARTFLLRTKTLNLLDIPASCHPRYNFLLQRSLISFLEKNNKVLMIFAGEDFVTWAFKSEFQDKVLRPGNPYKAHCQIEIIPHANHIFTGSEPKAAILSIMDTWLGKHFHAL